MTNDPLSIDMHSPEVRAMLGGDQALAPTKKREAYQVAGDMDNGFMSTVRLDSGKQETLVLYRGSNGDYVMTVDVYQIPGEPMQVHYICPRCRKQGRIQQDAKAIDWNPHEHRVLDMPDGQKTRTGGILSIEPFECTWEIDNEEHKVGIRSGGLTLCRLKLAIDANIAMEA